jgi:hypothetical protein
LADRGGKSFLPAGLVAAVAIVLALFSGGGSKAPAPKDRASAPMASATENPESDPLRLLFAYLDPRGGSASAPTCGPGAPYSLRFLVATVPDPVDSHLVPSFDRALDAIQGAMEDDGYVLDRFFLPWKRDGEAPAAGDSQERKTTRGPPANLQRKQPGVLLFRGEPPREDLVLVLLVGETPTSGIQREAMNRALDSVARCSEKRPPCLASCGEGDLAILGPYFSGSTPSLRNLLHSWNADGRRIRIVSGSATVNSNARWLRSKATTFEATVIPDDALKAAFFDYLKDRLRVRLRKDVALFIEGGTPYGESFGAIDRGPAFVVRFPLHVSQLRGAYQKNLASQGSNAGSAEAPRQALELPLDPSRTDERDAIPPQDPRMAANLADLALSTGVETIRREDIRFVGLVASDPRDILFLARKLREAGANVTLFTFGADVLYTHPDYGRYLRGMLVATPYPLFPANQHWSGSAGERTAFAGSSEEGIYNAVRSLLSPSRRDDPRLLAEYQAPWTAAPRRPPVWITAVGHGGFWPVTIQPLYPGVSYVLPDPKPKQKEVPGAYKYRPPGAMIGYVLIEALLIGVIAACVALRRTPKPAAPGRRTTLPAGLVNRAESVLSVWSEPPARGINLAYLATLLTQLVLLQTALALCAHQAVDFLPRRNDLFVFALVVLVALAILAAREWIRLFDANRRRALGERSLWRYAVVPGLVLIGWSVALALYALSVSNLEKPDRIAFFARVLDLTSSVSPALPFLFTLLVTALWAFSNMQRAYLLETQAGSGGASNISEGLAELRRLQADIQSLLEDPNARLFTLLVPVVAFVPFYRLVGRPIDSMDGYAWSRLLEYALLACYFVIVHSVALFLALWLRVRRLLRRLSWHPLAEAFQRLPEANAGSPWHLWNMVPNLTGFDASVSQLATLVRLGQGRLDEDRRKDLCLKTAEARGLFRRALAESAGTFAESLPTQGRLARVLEDATAQVYEALEVVWRSGPYPAGARIEPRRIEGEESLTGVKDWLRRDVPGPTALWARAAEEFVALRFSSFLVGVFLQIRNLLTFAFLGFLLSIAAINAYPIQPMHPLMALVWTMAVACTGVIAWAFIGMNRDRILSFIGKTAPGQITLNREFISSVGIYVVAPLLALLASQFPGMGDFIFSIFSPALKSLP